jgi:hypothetical protein
LEDGFLKNGTTRGYFEAFPRSVKRGILEWISNARVPETHAKRIEAGGKEYPCQSMEAVASPDRVGCDTVQV